MPRKGSPEYRVRPCLLALPDFIITDALSSLSKSPRLILDYLIPVLLLRGVLPSKKTLRKSERLSAIYTPFIAAYKSGDVGLYDRQLHAAEKRLMERGTYLIVERAREGAVRALLKKT